ncbi:MFS transporter [Exophiala viscosa]|uniref:MFS transporter n=1 Tax=Exophiala viscosa TaxID=2486360 RepID=A0AAN6DQL4_9EURO|nr:MFS transporter [Exophiala viscosa]
MSEGAQQTTSYSEVPASMKNTSAALNTNLSDIPTRENVPDKETTTSAARADDIANSASRELARHETRNTSLRRQSTTSTISRIPTATEPPTFTRLHEILFVMVITSAQLLALASLAQSIAPLHVIGRTFNTTDPGQLSWFPAAYSLTVGTFILPAGRWGDLYGHKKLFVIGYYWFALWSLIAGFSAFSHSIVFFSFCRAMQGIGPAIMIPNGLAVLSRTYPPGPKRNMVLSLFGATAPNGYLMGALFSGIFAQLVWWPWSCWVLGIVCALVGTLTIFVVPDMPVAGGKPAFKELDAVGTVLGVVGLILFNFAWNQGPVAGWQTVYVYVLLIVGACFIGVFFWYEKKLAKFPLVPMHSFTSDTMLVFGCEGMGWASFGIWIYFLWQFWELLRGQSIVLSSAMFVPAAISGSIAAITTGYLCGMMQPGWVMLMSMTNFLVGNILLATMPVRQTYWAQTFVSLIIAPWGMDMSFPSGVIVLANHMPPEHQGLAASLVNTVINYSISIGLGMAGTVEAHVNDGGKDRLKGYRGAWYLGIGLDALGFLMAIGLIFSWRATQKAKKENEFSDETVQRVPVDVA